MNDEPQAGGLINLWDWIAKPFLIFTALLFVIGFLAYPYKSVDQAYLGYYSDDNIIVGTNEWRDWHKVKLNESVCAGKEILNTIDVCGGYVTVFCKKRWSFAYNWCEVHSIDTQCYWQWWYE